MSKPTELELHPGHWKLPNSGAVGLIQEVTEARRAMKRVYEILKAAKVPVTYYEDNTSTNQKDNVNNLIKHHNADQNGLIVSGHFNSSGATTSKGIGVEVLYSTQKELATELSKAISDSTGGGLINRGSKYRDDLGVLVRTVEPAILIEFCFVNSSTDVAIYKRDFEKICQAVARVLASQIGYNINKGSELTVGQYEELKEMIQELQKQVSLKAPVTSTNEVGPSHKEAYEWAKAVGLTDGSNPSGALIRQQNFTILHRFYETFIANRGEVSDWSADKLAQAVKAGITDGSNPRSLATREQVALMILNATQK